MVQVTETKELIADPADKDEDQAPPLTSKNEHSPDTSGQNSNGVVFEGGDPITIPARYLCPNCRINRFHVLEVHEAIEGKKGIELKKLKPSVRSLMCMECKTQYDDVAQLHYERSKQV